MSHFLVSYSEAEEEKPVLQYLALISDMEISNLCKYDDHY